MPSTTSVCGWDIVFNVLSHTHTHSLTSQLLQMRLELCFQRPSGGLRSRATLTPGRAPRLSSVWDPLQNSIHAGAAWPWLADHSQHCGPGGALAGAPAARASNRAKLGPWTPTWRWVRWADNSVRLMGPSLCGD